MAKTLISRLDAENIVRAAVDPETHEATGDVYDSVNDVSYPFGGGGGGETIPTLTATILNSTGFYRMQLLANGPYENGHIGVPLEVENGATVTGKFLYQGDDEYGYGVITQSDPMVQIKSYSNNINCTLQNAEYTEQGGYGMILITDPTQDSSITIELEDTPGVN